MRIYILMERKTVSRGTIVPRFKQKQQQKYKTKMLSVLGLTL